MLYNYITICYVPVLILKFISIFRIYTYTGPSPVVRANHIQVTQLMPNTGSPKATRAEKSVAESLEDFYSELDTCKDAFIRAGICVIHQDLI